MPAANSKINNNIMSETFLLSNIVPQNPKHNRVVWKKLEDKIRNLVKLGNDIYVVTGTVYNANYKTIGASKVGVPNAMYKVVINNTNKSGIAFLIPNKAVDNNLYNYAVSIRQIEEKTGVNFNPQLPKNLEDIETKINQTLLNNIAN